MHPTERLNMYRPWADWLASADEVPPSSTSNDLDDDGHRLVDVCGLRHFGRYVVDHFANMDSNMRNRNLLRGILEMPSVVVDVPESPAGNDNETPAHYMPILFTLVAILCMLVPIIACIRGRRALLQDISGPPGFPEDVHPRVVLTMSALPCGFEKGGADAMSDELCSEDYDTDTSDDDAAEEVLALMSEIESWPNAVVSTALFSAIERQKELHLTFDEIRHDLGDKTDSDTDSDRLRRIVAIVVRKPANVSKLMLDMLRDAKPLA